MPSRFVQIHTLTHYPASLLNRDDVGMAKRIPFGGASRTRVSSQCLKRHWRLAEGPKSLKALGEPMSVRSRVTFDRFVLQPLLADGVDEAVARAAVETVMKELLGESAKAAEKRKASKDEDGGESAHAPVETGQVTVLGKVEVDYLLSVAQKICQDASDAKAVPKAAKAQLKEVKKALANLRLGTGLDAALFGRMVTSDVLANTDAPVHVAHAFTVHSESSETDYFTAVDDLVRGEGEKGSGHIGSTELTTGLFYGYVAIDVPLLVSNIEGCPADAWENADRALASRVVGSLIHTIATVSPGAKLGSTAPHSYASCVLVEAGEAQPRTLANAFLQPIPSRGDLLSQSYAALGDHLLDLERMYATGEDRAFAALGSSDALRGAVGRDSQSLPDVIDWAAGQVAG